MIGGPSYDPGCAADARGTQSGYSIVEVMAAIMILILAILPMVGMFDAALRAAVLGIAARGHKARLSSATGTWRWVIPPAGSRV